MSTPKTPVNGRTGADVESARLIETYNPAGLGDELLERWTRTENRSSLQQLATYFNQHLLRAKLQVEGQESLEGEVENLYELLTYDEATSGVRQEARGHLARRGINVDALEEDPVLHKAA